MRLWTLTLSTTLSAALLSGCSFLTGQPGQYKNPQQGQYGQYNQATAAHHCQISAPTQPIPRGCRPEQVTLGVNPQAQAYGGPNYGTNGFPQQPQFGQAQYTDGAYGSAVGQSASLAHHTPGSRKRKPKLRGSFSIGVEKSIDGDLIDPNARGLIGVDGGYNPQDFNLGFSEGSIADGVVRSTRFTANNLAAGDVLTGDLVTPGDPNAIFAPNQFDSLNASAISLSNAWSTPTNIKGGLEYIVNDKFTTFANVGYTYAEGEFHEAASIEATPYSQISDQLYDTATLATIGDPQIVGTTFLDTQNIASFSYDVSSLEQFDLEVGGRYYFNPIVKNQGFRTVTPFVGASVGASRVNAVDVNVSQRQTSYQAVFEGADETTFEVPGTSSTRLYDAEWLPQGQLNIGAEWQLTPRFALAAETGLKVQGSREYNDFTNADGETISGRNGDTNFSIPLTLRGSVNF